MHENVTEKGVNRIIESFFIVIYGYVSVIQMILKGEYAKL
jgi:hypothetical protein